jgi:homoserine kinase
MHRVKITLPASVTNLGPGLNSLGLAIGLYTTIEISRRNDESLVVETSGEGAGRYGTGLRHPVVLALMRVFQKQERAVLGMTIKINNNIPLNSGLGAEAAFWVAGVIGANNLLGAVYTREKILEISAQISQWPNHTVTAILGGLTASILNTDSLLHRALPVTALTLVMVVPELENYGADISRVKPERVPLNDAIHNLSRVPLLIEGLRSGDLTLIGRVLDDRLQLPYLKPYLTGYEHVAEMARRAGAQAVTLSGEGPTMIAFAADNHQKIATTMEVAFENVGVKARSWVLPVDRQGVVISVVQSS